MADHGRWTAPDLTAEERRAGFVRRDPDSGKLLRPGWLTDREFAAWSAEISARWRAALCVEGSPPKLAGDWVWTWSVGHVRRNEWARSKGSKKRTDDQTGSTINGWAT
jgi:hypothetical protein